MNLTIIHGATGAGKTTALQAAASRNYAVFGTESPDLWREASFVSEQAPTSETLAGLSTDVDALLLDHLVIARDLDIEVVQAMHRFDRVILAVQTHARVSPVLLNTAEIVVSLTVTRVSKSRWA